MKIELREVAAKKIINVYRHADPWFWNRYSAHPYIGCRSGCVFCYLRSGTYIGKRDPEIFDTVIDVKTNAVALLKKELAKLPKEVIALGDWQEPAEKTYRLSRQMLEVVLENAFPLFVVERSPLLSRDADLLQAIHRKSRASVAVSFSPIDPALKHAFEPKSPGVKKRLEMMAKIAAAGVPVGASLMPVIPFFGDDAPRLSETLRAIKDHGGSFVIAGGLTLGGLQQEKTLAAATTLDPKRAEKLRAGFEKNTGAAFAPKKNLLGLRVRELCQRFAIADRMPRPIPEGPLALNRRIAEKLALRTYDLELEGAASSRIWAYRKAFWSIDGLDENLSDFFHREGETGLQRFPGIGEKISSLIALWLKGSSGNQL